MSAVKLVPKTVERREGVKAALENVMELIEAENLTGIAIVAVDAQGFTHTAFEPGENIPTLLGGLVRLEHLLIAELESR